MKSRHLPLCKASNSQTHSDQQVQSPPGVVLCQLDGVHGHALSTLSLIQRHPHHLHRFVQVGRPCTEGIKVKQSSNLVAILVSVELSGFF